jgi:hypothetical protein
MAECTQIATSVNHVLDSTTAYMSAANRRKKLTTKEWREITAFIAEREARTICHSEDVVRASCMSSTICRCVRVEISCQ